jgi:alkanesulfonate monooxygenase SsuD/methylene tetrahydromethanopterin reductase-like flavin-dependent oxidoreductase (luciferase family)
MRLGICILPEHRWHDGGEEIWRRAEQLGFATGWTYDHLAWRNLRNSPWFGAVPTLTAAAVATSRMRLGTLVASPTFRHPVTLVRDLLTLDDVSGGRFTLGIGAGGQGWDDTIMGGEPLPPRERADRFREFVELTDLLLREREVSWEGRYYSAVEARSHPGPVQQPRIPFAIAATGPRGMKLAAQYGQAWVTTGPDVAAQVAMLEEACAAVGRDPSSIERIALTGLLLEAGLGSAEEFADTAGRYAEMGVTELVVHWPRDSEPYRGDVTTFERIIASA